MSDEPIVVDDVTQPVDVVTLDDAASLVGDALGSYDSAVDARYQDLSADLAGLSASVSALADSQDLTTKQVSKLASSSPDSTATYVVALSSEQWDTVRECWVLAKTGGALALFLALVCTLLVAALLGSRLWSAFSKGWRHG